VRQLGQTLAASGITLPANLQSLVFPNADFGQSDAANPLKMEAAFPSMATFTSSALNALACNPQGVRSTPQPPSAVSVGQPAAQAQCAIDPADANATGKRPAEGELENPAKQIRTTKYYLIKSEPQLYSIDMLMSEPNMTCEWDGVRSYEARNLMGRMREGDLALFYHSNCKDPGVVGVVEVVKEYYPDWTAWTLGPGFDPKSPQTDPKWWMVDVRFAKRFKLPIALSEIKVNPKLKQMQLLTRPRLEISVVTQEEWDEIMAIDECRLCPAR
jgi:predicted RNA-binding protein with PUA-like domain